MTKLLTLVICLGTVACATKPSPVAPTSPPTPTPIVQQTPAPSAAVTRIIAGGTPGSNTHQWGSRSFELRAIDGATQIRLHDEWSFQGVGMQPKDMGPNRHVCTPWEPFPDDLARTVPAGIRACGDTMAHGVCEPIYAWFEATKPAPSAQPAPMDGFEHGGMIGRPSAACDAG
jgi:hypothetical protein